MQAEDIIRLKHQEQTRREIEGELTQLKNELSKLLKLLEHKHPFDMTKKYKKLVNLARELNKSN